MNVHGLCHLCAFVGYGVAKPRSYRNHESVSAANGIGFHLPRPPSGFNLGSDLPQDVRQFGVKKGPPLFQMPDCGPEGVVSYAGIYKTLDNLPRRTLEYADIDELTRTGVLPEIGRMLRETDVESLSRLQLALFDELAYGSNALFHSETSTGKTFSMLLYATLRYYYGVSPSWLCSQKVQELFDRSRASPAGAVGVFAPPSSPTLNRVMVLCPTKELALQCAKQLIQFAGGDTNCVRLIIDDQALLPEDIGPQHVFVVGAANQLNLYLLTKSKRYIRGIMQHVGMVILDEVDRLVKVANQYATTRRKMMYRKNPTAAFQICQALLSLSPNRLQLVGASASISRNHIRFMDATIQSYRKSRCPLAVIRNNDDRTASNRYVSVPDEVEHFFAASNTDSLGNKVGKVVTILRTRPSDRVLFFVSSKHSLLSFTHYLERCGFQCKVLHHEFGIRDNVSKRFSGEVVKGVYDRRESTEVMDKYDGVRSELDSETDGCMYAASMDSARGLHFSALDTVYMIGIPRNVDEYVHISGRVGRCGRKGRCILVDTIANVRKALTWQTSINCTILPLSDTDAKALSEFKGYIPKVQETTRNQPRGTAITTH
ncbi:ATP-dependent RNA helicase RhlB [Babesia sp. Xinjiang]|uniref:ATP-dependent RNA helicase RhlB n=1 Tax=Babesia sp. Xinjiang TaxID=462227 RepID=UPI000A21F233|nr:ATP-dependent RNA helicase RhlB [Babesia sp. Xinjiang]ORM40130.1 ATP-dependent RNA helicase RhlB [Babesia sp. Xinjiang]